MPELLQLGLDGSAPSGGDPSYRLDIGRVVTRTFSVTFANLPAFVTVALLVYSPALLMVALAATLPLPADSAMLMLRGAEVVERILSLVLSGALTYGVIQHLRGGRAPLGQTVGIGLRSAFRVFLVSLLSGLVTLIGLILCIVPGVMLFCALWVAVPVAVMEHTGIQESMDRSQHLTSGTRWQVLAVNVLMALITGVVMMVLFGCAIGFVTLVGSRDGNLSPSMQAVGTLLGSLLLLPVQCLQATADAVGYHDLRVHREGADVEDLVRIFE